MRGEAQNDSKLRAELRTLRGEVRRLRRKLRVLTPPLAVLLRRRGFTVHKKEPVADLLVPDAQYVDGYYRLLHKYSFRLFLRDAIQQQDRFTVELLTRYSAARTVRAYIGHLVDMGMASPAAGGFRLTDRPVLSFGPTLEWYVAELLKREFGAEVCWGVTFRGSRAGGDYDVLAKLDGSVFYVEVKSSPPKQIYDREISAFLDRVGDLGPEIAVFLMDTELRMKDKIVPLFEQALAKRADEPPAVVRIERELFQAQDRIFIVNAKESIAANIAAIVSRYVRSGRSQ